MDDTPESTYHTGEENIPRHARYYLEDGNVTFLVGNTLFQVHRYQFQDSPYFHAVEANRDADTDSSYIYVAPEERAIELRDIKHFDFEALLEILYTPIFVEYPYPISTSKWSAILRMAHLWQFYDLKNFSFQRLELLPIHPVDKIVLYRECGLSHMLRAAYAELCARDQPISLNEGLLLGMETVTNIFKIRESVFRQQWSFRTEISPEELEHWRDALILDLFPSVAAGPPVPVGKIVDTTPRMNGLQLDVSSPVTLTSKVPEVATPERPKVPPKQQSAVKSRVPVPTPTVKQTPKDAPSPEVPDADKTPEATPSKDLFDPIPEPKKVARKPVPKIGKKSQNKPAVPAKGALAAKVAASTPSAPPVDEVKAAGDVSQSGPLPEATPAEPAPAPAPVADAAPAAPQTTAVEPVSQPKAASTKPEAPQAPNPEQEKAKENGAIPATAGEASQPGSAEPPVADPLSTTAVLTASPSSTSAPLPPASEPTEPAAAVAEPTPTTQVVEPATSTQPDAPVPNPALTKADAPLSAAEPAAPINPLNTAVEPPAAADAASVSIPTQSPNQNRSALVSSPEHERSSTPTSTSGPLGFADRRPSTPSSTGRPEMPTRRALPQAPAKFAPPPIVTSPWSMRRGSSGSVSSGQGPPSPVASTVVRASTPDRQAAERNAELREIKRSGTLHERRISFEAPQRPAASGWGGLWNKAKGALAEVGQAAEAVAGLRREREIQEEREMEIARQEVAARREQEARKLEEARKSPTTERPSPFVMRARRLQDEAEAKRLREEAAKRREEEAKKAQEAGEAPKQANAEWFQDEAPAVEAPKAEDATADETPKAVTADDQVAATTATVAVDPEPSKNEEGKPVEPVAPEITITNDADAAGAVDGTAAQPDDTKTTSTVEDVDAPQYAEVKGTPDSSALPTALTNAPTATESSFPTTPVSAALPEPVVVTASNDVGDGTPGTPTVEEIEMGGGPGNKKKNKKKKGKGGR